MRGMGFAEGVDTEEGASVRPSPSLCHRQGASSGSGRIVGAAVACPGVALLSGRGLDGPRLVIRLVTHWPAARGDPAIAFVAEQGRAAAPGPAAGELA